MIVLELPPSKNYNMIIRPSLEKYLDVSSEVVKLFSEFLTIWKEKGTDYGIDVIEARKIFAFMLNEDQKREKPHALNPVFFGRHSWVVGEYAADIAEKLIGKHPEMADNGLLLPPKEMKYAGGSHDIAKLFLKDDFQYAHEHAAYLLLMDNGCESLADLTQPHHPW